jgi:flavin reductase (DIM6/NTAB) family NADH-FMN oxidoreductase RutF
MKTFNPKDIHPRAFYSLFTGVISPRPIAWVLTKNESHILNLAPYSFFSGVNTRPPMVMLSIGTMHDQKKHTTQNIIASKQCVIHIVDASMIDVLNSSAKAFSKDESEVDILNLEVIPSQLIDTPQLKHAIATLECVLYQHIKLPTNDMFILEVVALHIDESSLKDGQIDVLHVKPLSRFMGNYYGVDYTFVKKEHPDSEE